MMPSSSMCSRLREGVGDAGKSGGGDGDGDGDGGELRLKF